ncbi:phage replisome organizer N-terminal domain-containing protein [Bacillus thuringiensis]|nr:phage replisome organizer N-terminal domain-containing protein [Bacillus thuringiensis]
MSEIKWIKLSVDIFSDEKIKMIETLPDGDGLLICWFKLLVLTGKTNDNGHVYFMKDFPYTDEMLAKIFDRPVNLIRAALDVFVKFKMIQIDECQHIIISNWEKHQNVEGMEQVKKLRAVRNKRYYEKKKRLELSENEGVKTSEKSLTKTEQDVLDIDLDKDIKNIKPFRNKYEICHMDAAKYFHNLILSRNDNFKNPNLESWANDIRLMQERDNRSLEDIKKVMDWCQKDTFWMNNVLSIAKLRKQFDQLYMKMNETGDKYAKNRGRDEEFNGKGASYGRKDSGTGEDFWSRPAEDRGYGHRLP